MKLVLWILIFIATSLVKFYYINSEQCKKTKKVYIPIIATIYIFFKILHIFFLSQRAPRRFPLKKPPTSLLQPTESKNERTNSYPDAEKDINPLPSTSQNVYRHPHQQITSLLQKQQNT
jgi:hypothetical protein